MPNCNGCTPVRLIIFERVQKDIKITFGDPCCPMMSARRAFDAVRSLVNLGRSLSGEGAIRNWRSCTSWKFQGDRNVRMCATSVLKQKQAPALLPHLSENRPRAWNPERQHLCIWSP